MGFAPTELHEKSLIPVQIPQESQPQGQGTNLPQKVLEALLPVGMWAAGHTITPLPGIPQNIPKSGMHRVFLGILMMLVPVCV